jgi:hypothetical protein
MTKVFFVVDFCHLVTKTKRVATCSKGFCGKKIPKSPFFGETKIEFAILCDELFSKNREFMTEYYFFKIVFTKWQKFAQNKKSLT